MSKTIVTAEQREESVKAKEQKLELKRNYGEKQTKGDVSYKDFECKALELPWLNNKRFVSCIPEGEYFCTKEMHSVFGEVIRVHDVHGRSGILWHFGNYAGSLNPKTSKPDTLGCTLPGESFIDIDGDGLCDITNSKNTMEALYNVLPPIFTLKIYS